MERAIYLDADITLNGSLDDLFSMDMRGMPLAAAPDNEGGRAIERSVRDLPDDFRYYNAGVFLADLAMWRRENIADQMISFARATTAPLYLMDQSVINIVLQRRILPLDRSLNTYDITQFEDVSDPIVIHHCGRWKPWRASWSAFHDLYRFHRSQTPWPLQELGLGKAEVQGLAAADGSAAWNSPISRSGGRNPRPSGRTQDCGGACTRARAGPARRPPDRKLRSPPRPRWF